MADIRFKEPIWIIAWLEDALEKEKKKLKACPINRDMVPGCEVAQAWGYVVAGYFLIEMSFKALLHLQGINVAKGHSLTKYFDLLGDADKDILREYYSDYRMTCGSHGLFPIETLDEFLLNLDGDQNDRGYYVGSFDWRYFPIEEKQSAEMPLVAIEFLHEIAYASHRMLGWEHYGKFEPSKYTNSWRMRWDRVDKTRDWLTVRMNSEGGMDEGTDRLEILWGPDYKGRHDLLLVQGGRISPHFGEIPEDFDLPIEDKREEWESFDAEEGFRSIGIRVVKPQVESTR